MDEFWKELLRDFIYQNGSKIKSRIDMINDHHFTPHSIKRYIIISFSIQIMCLTLSYLFYPKSLHYSIFTHLMSFLGNFYINPGWIFFSTFLILVGLSIIPLISEIIRVLDMKSKWGINLTRFCYILADLSLIAVGFFPDIQRDGYYLAQTHYFFSIGTLVMFSIVGAITWGRGRGEMKWCWGKYFGIIYYSSLICTILSLLIDSIYNIPYLEPGLLSVSFWEWILFFTYLFFLYSMAIEVTEIKARESTSLSQIMQKSTPILIQHSESNKTD
jgi:hypothetical protein